MRSAVFIKFLPAKGAQCRLEEKKKTLMEMHGHYLGHGWFDAVSPQINDLLNFSEIVELLKRLGYQNIKRTRDNNNHYIIADKT
jgi:hypothetical protein